MALTFDYIKNITSNKETAEPKYMERPYLVQEPNGDLYIYYAAGNPKLAYDRRMPPYYGEYYYSFHEKPGQHVTLRAVDYIGAKHVPHFGAMAFFKDTFEGIPSILLPVHEQRELLMPPDMSLTIKDKKIEVKLTTKEEDDIKGFSSFRIELRNGEFAEEHICYLSSFTIPLPIVKGEYTVTVVGYDEKNNDVSLRSAPQTINVAEGKDTWDPEPMRVPMKLGDLVDVNIADLLNEQLLSYDETTGRWYNRTIPDGDKEEF